MPMTKYTMLMMGLLILVSCDSSTKKGLTIIRNVSIIDPDQETLMPNIDVAISDGRISGIKPNITERGDLEIDGSKKYLLPGLIDAHVHIRDTSNLKLFLYTNMEKYLI